VSTALLDERRPRVFISHSTHEPEARATLLRVVEALKGDGFDVLVDYERLETGWEWRDELYSWLAHCDAAVALLSPAALARPWVKAEAQILWYRRRNERDHFPLLPILVDGAKPADFERLEDWDPVPLRDLQSRVWPVADDVAGDEIVTRLLADLRPLKERVARTPLEVALAGKLRAIGDEALAAAARRIGMEQELTGDERYVRMSRRLLQVELAALADAVTWVAIADPKIAQEVFGLAVAYAWVDGMAAAQIVEAMLREHDIAINAEQPLTSHMYVRRACTIFPFWDVVAIERGRSGDVDAMLESAHEALARKFAVADPADRALLSAELRQRPVFLVVPCPLLDEEVVSAFRREFPTVTHIFLAGDGDLDATEVERRAAGNVRYLLPKLEPGRETAAIARYLSVVDELKEAERRARDAYELPLVG
jgi:hypothetical protein